MFELGDLHGEFIDRFQRMLEPRQFGYTRELCRVFPFLLRQLLRYSLEREDLISQVECGRAAPESLHFTASLAKLDRESGDGSARQIGIGLSTRTIELGSHVEDQGSIHD